MTRVPYEVVAIEADRIIMKMVIASSWDSAFHYWDLYLEFLDACGWSDREFDCETLKRIDAAWTNIKRQNRN